MRDLSSSARKMMQNNTMVINKETKRKLLNQFQKLYMKYGNGNDNRKQGHLGDKIKLGSVGAKIIS